MSVMCVTAHEIGLISIIATSVAERAKSDTRKV